METRVFHYRSAGLYVVIGFLAIWSIGWLTGVVTNWNSGKATINERPATAEQAQIMQWAFLGIGLLILAGTLSLVTYAINARIEISNGWIREFNWLGRLKTEGSLRSASIQADGENAVRVVTDGGSFKVATTLSHYGAFKTMVEQKVENVEAERLPVSTYRPAERTFRPRWSQLHLFSFVWLGMIGFMITKSIEFGSSLFVIAPILFAVPGIWMQLVGWVEKVSIDPEGIVWIDFLGRTRVQATWEEVVGGDTLRDSESSSVQVHTLRGTISPSQGTWGQRNLIEEVAKVVAGRPTLEPQP